MRIGWQLCWSYENSNYNSAVLSNPVLYPDISLMSVTCPGNSQSCNMALSSQNLKHAVFSAPRSADRLPSGGRRLVVVQCQ